MSNWVRVSSVPLPLLRGLDFSSSARKGYWDPVLTTVVLTLFCVLLNCSRNPLFSQNLTYTTPTILSTSERETSGRQHSTHPQDTTGTSSCLLASPMPRLSFKPWFLTFCRTCSVDYFLYNWMTIWSSLKPGGPHSPCAICTLAPAGKLNIPYQETIN